MIKQLFSKYKWYLIGGAVIFVVLMPLGINALFKFPALLPLFSAEWSASDALSFYGAILTAIIGAIGVYWSIQAAQKSYHEDERNSVKPYLAVSLLATELSYGLAFLLNDTGAIENERENNYYKEFKVDRLYAVIDKDKVTLKAMLKKDGEKLLHQGGWGWVPIETEDGGRRAFRATGMINAPFEIENVGRGAAIDVRAFVYSSKAPNHQWTAFFTIPVNTKVCIQVCSTWNEICGDYIMAFEYRDVLGLWYRQEFYISFVQREDENKEKHTIQRIDLRGTQNSITEAQANGQP